MDTPTLAWVDRRFLDRAWPVVAPLLAKAVACNQGEASLDQVRLQLVNGVAELLVAESPAGVIGAAVMEFINHPNYRVAHVSYISGITSRELFEQLKDWCRSMGATKIEGFGSDAIARLWSRYGFEKAYNLVRADL